MAKTRPKSQFNWALPVQILLLVALCISLYLLFEVFRGKGVAGCGPDSGCGSVLASQWGYFMGLPISLLAATLYCTMLAALHSATHGHPPARHIAAGGAWLILGAAAWFILLQAAVLKAFCWYCMTAHLTGAVASVIVLTKLSPPFRLRTLAVPAIAMAALLVVQIKFPDKTFTKTVIAPQATNAVAAATSSVPVAVPAPAQVVASVAAPPQISVMGGRFQIPANAVPMIGDLATPNVMVKLFDYTCHHCRHLHELLAQSQSSLSNKLVIYLPMPLDGACNRLITRTPAAHVGACNYTKLSLAVWNTAPEKWKELDTWLWQPAKPAPIEDARAFAARLIGEAQLSSALTNARLQSQINISVDIYEANSKNARKSSMPQLMFPSSTVIGSIRDQQELQTLLDTSF